MRKSLTAAGSSDLGSAIWPTTSTPGGVWAAAGAARLVAIKAPTAAANRLRRVHSKDFM